MLIPLTGLENGRPSATYGHLELPQDPKIFLARIVAHLDQGLERLRDAYLRGEVRIEDGSVRNEVLVAEDTGRA